MEEGMSTRYNQVECLKVSNWCGAESRLGVRGLILDERYGVLELA
jgi:hypothetical protein